MYVNGGQSGWACEHDIVGETEECFNEIFGNNVFVICLSLKFDLTWSLAGDQWSAVQQLPSRPSQICHRYCDELTTCRKWAYAFSLGKVPSSGLIFCKTDIWFALAFKQVVSVIIFGRHKSHTKPVQTSIPRPRQYIKSGLLILITVTLSMSKLWNSSGECSSVTMGLVEISFHHLQQIAWLACSAWLDRGPMLYSRLFPISRPGLGLPIDQNKLSE